MTRTEDFIEPNQNKSDQNEPITSANSSDEETIVPPSNELIPPASSLNESANLVAPISNGSFIVEPVPITDSRCEVGPDLGPPGTEIERSDSQPTENNHAPEPMNFGKRLFISVKNKVVEQEPKILLKQRKKIGIETRRDFLIYSAGMLGAAAGFTWLLPDEIKKSFGFSPSKDALRERFFQSVLTFDDQVAKSIYSPSRLVPTYSKSQMTELPNNYAGETPSGNYVPSWKLNVTGLAAREPIELTKKELINSFEHHEEITRICCVEGWSAISWWGGVRFADFLKKFPPASTTKWIKLTSAVNLDSDGNSDPYFVSLDIGSALHPQTLLATHHNERELELEHGAPLRLLAPMKLGLKNIKAITSISYHATEPEDYWNQNGYSYYDGI
jgi:hypothetical protein